VNIPEPAEFARIPAHPGRPDPDPDANRRPFSDVASSEALELADFIGQTALRRYDLPARYWHAHLYYARHSALALADGDLWTAQRAAAITRYALTLYTRHGGTPYGPDMAS
jgi:hypothetical protein